MKSRYSFVDKKDYLQMKVVGDYDYFSYVQFPSIIKKECKKTGINKVLIHGLNVSAQELPVVERFFMAEKAAETFKDDIKIAIVWHSELIDGFMEAVATNRAARIKIFGTEELAREWLLTQE